MGNELATRFLAGFAAALLLPACAGTGSLIDSPTVRLNSVSLDKVSFSKQTFLLGFDVSNPNGFPLPVKMVKYRLLLDEQRFAGGETAAAFTVPARGDDAFTISVDLDMLNTANQISTLLRGGMPEAVDYRLEGSLTVDIPFARPLPFSSSGVIQVR